MDKPKLLIVSILTGILTPLSQKYGVLILLVCSAIVLDVVTGVIKAKINRTVSSKASIIGFWKKVSLLTGFTFGIFLDFLELYLIENSKNQLNLNIPFSIPIGLIIGIYIILNESISICENLYESGCKMPTFLVKALEVSQNKINSGQEKSNSKQD